MITRSSTDWSSGAAVKTTDTLFVGATLAVHWNSTRVMSDVWENCPYATVFNVATGKVEVVWRDRDGAAVDATPEVIDAANAWLLAAATASRKAKWDARVGDAVSAAHKVEKGKTVVVTKGRKVKKGTTGPVFWVGAGKAYGYYDRPADRIGIKDAAGVVYWTSASNVEVVSPDDYFDYDEWVTNAPNFAADAKAALDSTFERKYAEVILHAGEDRLGFSNWFTAPVAVKEAA